MVDGGSSGNKKFNPFISEVEKLPSHDLMILTHHDNDHLIGIKKYIKTHKNDEHFPINRLWVNCARSIDFKKNSDLSAAQASSLADTLKEIEKNKGIRWKEYITEGFCDDTIKFADIYVLNPSDQMLKRFIPKYEKKAGITSVDKGTDLSAQRSNEDFKICLKDLAKREKGKPSESDYEQFANMVSISFIVQCDGLSGLMLGDSYPDQIVGALDRKGYSKGNKLKVDFVKVAHHGSRNNISNELLDMIDCCNFIIPTNGGAAKSYHPDREAIANILCHEGRGDETIHLYFNYSLKEIEGRKGFNLFHADDPQIYNFVIHEPQKDSEGCQYRVSFN